MDEKKVIQVGGKLKRVTLESRNGVVIEKGIALNPERVKQNRALYEHWCNFFTAYPDRFIDMITPAGSGFQLFFYQRIFLRVCLRFPNHYCVAPRAFSKTFLSILAMFLKCMFQPGIKVFLTAPVMTQSARICKEKLVEIFDLFPMLKREVRSPSDPPGNYGKDYVQLTFNNLSVFDVVGANYLMPSLEAI
jgi:hypothetical protein